MITIGVGKIFSPFIGEMNALGYAMHFLPALYGALLVIPVYYIGKTLFNKKAGIIAALLIPLIPIHISSGHGSAYSLYDHDSFILLLLSTTFMFLLMSLKEKDTKRSTIYAALSGVSVAAVSMTWVSAQYIYAVIAVYAVVQMVMDIFTQKMSLNVVRTILVTLFTGYILAFPLYWIKSGFSPNLPFFICIGVAAFSLIYIWLSKNRIPWIISLPSIFGIGGIGVAFLYLIRNTTNSILSPLKQLSDILFGGGIYGKKVSLTIAEAGTFGLSRTVMSFGPIIYWLGWLGFIMLLYHYYKGKWRREYLLVATWFMVEVWLCTTAGRFLNDLVPLMAVLGGWIMWMVIDKLDFSKMARNIRGVGGGWYGIKKGVKLGHIFGVLFIAFCLLPNGWMAFDASVPVTEKGDFGMEGGAFGLGLYKEGYWTDALSWLSEQDNEINDSTQRPAFIAWWDYGFYEAAIGDHPTVAENFQHGIPPASNFKTAQSEKEAIAVWIVRLIEGDVKNNNEKVSPKIEEVLTQYVGENESLNLTNILENPKKYAPSYNEPIGGGFNVRAENAKYHDGVDILSRLSDDKITWLYHDIQNITNWSIRYYGTERYDLQIFNVFTFLADVDQNEYFESSVINSEWKFMNMSEIEESPSTRVLCMPYSSINSYIGSYGMFYGGAYLIESAMRGLIPHSFHTLEETRDRNVMESGYTILQVTHYKEKFYNSMFYKVFFGQNYDPYGIIEGRINPYDTASFRFAQMRLPTYGMKHFVAEYVSPEKFSGMPVVIAKYYEGAYINGTITSNGELMDAAVSVIDDKLGLPHDSVFTINGNFSLIAPAGNISLMVTTSSGEVKLKTITFNSTTDPQRAPITEDDAMRCQGSNYSRWINISIERGSVEGIVFWDKDGDGEYNESMDEPMGYAKVNLGEEEKRTDSKGRYSFHNLIPGSYTITATKKGYDDGSAKVAVEPNATAEQNISMIPSKVTTSGVVWYDKNGNNHVDKNESIADIPIKFTVIDAPDENAVNATATSNSTGHYEESLFPATYKIEIDYNATEGNETIHYTYSGEIEIKIGDSDKTKNIKLKTED
jgi:dolichyl-diphosphooligosaccharide--protein glycosyltransferase